MLIITIISAIATIVCSYFQLNNPNIVALQIINNIVICLLSGCLLIFIQSVISYNYTKRESILCFYKNIMILEKLIHDHSVIGRGFNLAKQGYQDILTITRFFEDAFKMSYMEIDSSNQKNLEIQSVKQMFQVYNKYREMEKHLGQAINFAEQSDEELAGIDIKSETQKYNLILSKQIKEIAEEFGNEDKIETIKTNKNLIVKYLFD